MNLAGLSMTPPVDILTLPWTIYHEQGRGTATDYNPAGSPPWVGHASAGPSLGRDLIPFGSGPWGLPIVGPAVGGTTSVRFNDDLDDLKHTLTALNYVSVSEFTIAVLVRFGSDAQNLVANACLAYASRIRLHAGKTGGLGQCQLQTTSGIDNFALSPTFALDTWVAIFARLKAGVLDVRVDEINGTPTAGVANVNAGIASETPRVAQQLNGTTVHNRHSGGWSTVAYTDAECDLARSWWQYVIGLR